MKGIAEKETAWKEMRECRKEFCRAFPKLGIGLALVILVVYGIRITDGSIFLDSELMTVSPDYMRYVWMGSSRFGMVASSRLFGLHRMSPWMSNVLMACVMWCCGMLLAFCAWNWSGRTRRSRYFTVLYPFLFLTAPVFTEQYLFVLQSFEISFGILMAITAAYISDRWCRGALTENRIWAGAGLLCLVWAVGTYQVMAPMYICLVLTAFVLRYMNGSVGHGLRYGFRQLAFFAAGCVLYAAAVIVSRKVSGADSAYVDSMIRWQADGLKACLEAVRTSVRNVLQASNVFYRGYYLPAMVLCTAQMIWYGWRRKEAAGNFICYLLGILLLMLTPFYMNILTGGAQPMRTQLVYPLAAAFFLAHLTMMPADGQNGEAGGAGDMTHGRSDKQGRTGKFAEIAAVCMTAVCVFCSARQGMDTIQLYQTGKEAYRNDVLTANRMYQDICEAADRSDMENCRVIFIGGRDAGIKGPAVYGELVGRSLFDAEAHTAAGVSARLGNFFSILGMDIQVAPDDLDAYHRAIAWMQDAPDWPAEDSVQMMDNTVLVKLSDSWIEP